MKKRSYYSVFLNIKERKCVVIGGGSVAERKVRALLKAEAAVTVISPTLSPGLKKLHSSGKIIHKKRKYRKGDTKNAFLVIAGTSDERVNRKASMDAESLMNAVDMPEYGNFIVPSVLTKGPLTVSISTSGISPSLARSVRKRLEKDLPEDLGEYLAYISDIRKLIQETLSSNAGKVKRKRENLLKKLGSKEILDMLEEKGFVKTKAYINQMVHNEMNSLTGKKSI